MKKSAVYKITNTITNDFYIGSSKNVKHRWANHKYQSTWKNNPNNPMYLDMKKYGVEKFEFEILEEVEIDRLKEKEQWFIETLKPAYNSNRANGLDTERNKEWHKERYNKHREAILEQKKQYYESHKEQRKQYRESHKEEILKQKKQYNNQLCYYNGQTLKLNALVTRFYRAGIEHPTIEAKKYLLKNNNAIEFYDVYP